MHNIPTTEVIGVVNSLDKDQILDFKTSPPPPPPPWNFPFPQGVLWRMEEDPSQMTWVIQEDQRLDGELAKKKHY